ncbi:MAG TPA: DUF1800 domain-containing protein [Thermoanaerobaculia bacterium]|nr:DUF1800 domain-containing protein [Thermoanaerobaculia bacterium]
MHARALTPLVALAAVAVFVITVAAAPAPSALHMPWREAGWSEREAAAHLLDRFAFGARPGEVEKVVAMGLDRWLERQLAADLPDHDLDRRLARLDALEMSAAEMARQFPRPPRLLAEARRAGVVEGRGERARDEEMSAAGEEMQDTGEAMQETGEPVRDPARAETRRAVMRWAREQGYRPERELLGQLMAQKLYRAVYAENQLAEVLVDFWFNHFNVSLTDNRTRTYLLAYERDAIRPHVLGKFRTMLGATAQHPAMLVYLDNAQSSAAEGTVTLAPGMTERRRGGRRRPPEVRGGADGAVPELPEMQGATGAAREPEAAAAPASPERRRRPRGLNENYARELLELHTLGVDGGYTQQDVVEVARAFTGWTLMPPGGRRRAAQAAPARAERMAAMGYESNGAFLFRADLHDAGAKTVLGQRFQAGRGVEEGRQVLDLLAKHPATARHLARKLAVRFVGDEPPAALVERLAAVYTQTNGDLRRVVRAVAESPDFWAKEARGAKIKSPFELAVSAVRALGAEVADPRGLLQWTAQMGQRLYAYSAPTGFPDRADAWVNTGSLLNRMNFGLQLASGGVRGVRFDLAALAGGREPATREEAVALYAPLLLPGRALDGVIATLKPTADDPELAARVEAVGVILGSPEFQRR